MGAKAVACAAVALIAAAVYPAPGRCGEGADRVKISLEGRSLIVQGNRQPFPAEAFETPEKSWRRLAELLKPVLGARDADGRCPVVPTVSVDGETPSEALITVLMAVSGHGCRRCNLTVAAKGGTESAPVELSFDAGDQGKKGQVMTLKLVGQAGRERLDLDGQQISASKLDPLAPAVREAAKARALIRIRPEGKTSAARTVELVRFCRDHGAERFDLFDPPKVDDREREAAKDAKDAVDRALDGIRIGK
ncbi:MAG: hypothetical protein N3A38_14890 [Planctomycetota bacterium]|nr:hypothetical protein [Planctomycetota bacterium]